MVGASSLLLAFYGCGPLLRLMPKALFAALLVNSGFSLLVGNLLQARSSGRNGA